MQKRGKTSAVLRVYSLDMEQVRGQAKIGKKRALGSGPLKTRDGVELKRKLTGGVDRSLASAASGSFLRG